MVPSSWPHVGAASGPGGGGVWPDLDGLSQQELRALLQAHLDSPLGIGGPVDGSRSRAAEVVLPEPPRQVRVIVVRVDLDHARPAVWRRLRLRGDLTMDRVHDVLQGRLGGGTRTCTGSGWVRTSSCGPGRTWRPTSTSTKASRVSTSGTCGWTRSCRLSATACSTPSAITLGLQVAIRNVPPASLQQAHGAHRSRTTALYTPGTPAKTW